MFFLQGNERINIYFTEKYLKQEKMEKTFSSKVASSEVALKSYSLLKKCSGATATATCLKM